MKINGKLEVASLKVLGRQAHHFLGVEVVDLSICLVLRLWARCLLHSQALILNTGLPDGSSGGGGTGGGKIPDSKLTSIEKKLKDLDENCLRKVPTQSLLPSLSRFIPTFAWYHSQ